MVAPIHRLDYNNALEAGRRGERNQFIDLIAEIEFETQKDFMRYMNMEMPDFADGENNKIREHQEFC